MSNFKWFIAVFCGSLLGALIDDWFVHPFLVYLFKK